MRTIRVELNNFRTTCVSCGNQKPLNKRNITGKCRDCSRKKPGSTNYFTMHWRLRKLVGNPKHCSKCGIANIKDSKGRNKLQWAKKSEHYTDNPKDYIGLCISCHKKYDGIVSNIKGMRKYANSKG